jgi:hypothetical protein
MQKIFIFGNEDLEMDSLPLRILPMLRQRFPEIDFVTTDPNEDIESQCRSCSRLGHTLFPYGQQALCRGWDGRNRSARTAQRGSQLRDRDAQCRCCRGAPPSLADIVAIDTVVGIKDVTVFDSLDKFSAPPRVGMHDFDALSNLRLLFKLGKIKSVKIIAVPPEIAESEAIEKISQEIKKINTVIADSV